MRKPIAVFVAAFATVAGGGLAMALEAPPETVPPSPPVPEDSPALEQQHPRGGTPDDEIVEVVEEVDEVEELEEVDDVEEVDEVEQVEVVEAVEQVDPVEHPDNHGAWVSDHAQNVCVEQDQVAFGRCVSAAARDKDHDGTPDHGPGSDEATTGEVVEPDTAAGAPEGPDHGKPANARRPAGAGSHGKGRAGG